VRTHTQTDRQTDRHTPMTTRPCGLRRAGKKDICVDTERERERERERADLDAYGERVNGVTDAVVNRTSMTSRLTQTGQGVPSSRVFLGVVDQGGLASLGGRLARSLHQPQARPQPLTHQVPADRQRMSRVQCLEPSLV